MNIQKHNTPANDIQLTATDPVEMVNSQQNLISWCEGKIAFLQADAKELEEARDHAKKSKWKWQPLHKHFLKVEKRISYFQKIREALLAGYHIVPNFPIQMFAIRTTKETVVGYSTQYYADHEQNEQELKPGEGEYKNPWPLVRRTEGRKDAEGKVVIERGSRAKDWDEMEFPVTMAKPVIMRATSQAMLLKIFDRIGVMPATKKEDPVIIGQIINKTGPFTVKVVSFMIAWHLNTNVL